MGDGCTSKLRWQQPCVKCIGKYRRSTRLLQVSRHILTRCRQYQYRLYKHHPRSRARLRWTCQQMPALSRQALIDPVRQIEEQLLAHRASWALAMNNAEHPPWQKNIRCFGLSRQSSKSARYSKIESKQHGAHNFLS